MFHYSAFKPHYGGFFFLVKHEIVDNVTTKFKNGVKCRLYFWFMVKDRKKMLKGNVKFAVDTEFLTV